MTNADFITLQRTALDEVTAILGDTFTYKGTSYTGVISEVEFIADLLTGGQLDGLGAVIVASKSQLQAKPQVGETVKVGSSFMRVEKVKEDETSFEITAITAAA